MHELAYTENLYKTVCESIKKTNTKKVKEIHLSVTALSGIEQSSMQFYWDAITQDSKLEKAKIIVHAIPEKFVCRACQKEFVVKQVVDYTTLCIYCLKEQVIRIQPLTLQLDKIVLET